jgi:PAS domain S-box-containing protein
MASEVRNSGISGVGDVHWGTHFCCFYQTKQDLLDILVPYFEAGLRANEFCLWIVSNSELITNQEAKAALTQAVPELEQYLSEGRIEIVPHDLWWFLKSRTFDFQQAAQQFKEKLDHALAAGYVGMRVNGSPAWMRPEKHEELCEFEKEVDGIYPHLRIIAACTYPVSKSLAELLFDVASSHRFTIARRRGEWDMLETPELLHAKQQIERLNAALEQKVIERTQELRESQQLLQLVLATLPVGVSVTNQKGDIVLNNAASKEIWGRDIVVSGRERWAHSKGSWHDSGEKIAPADWASARALSQGQTSLHELIDIKTYDGQPKIIENSAAPIRNADGLIVGAVIVNEDVTERVQTEEALRKSEENFRKAFESSPAPAAISRRRDRHVLNVNSAYVRTFGYTAEEAIGKTPDELGVWPDERERQEFWQRVQSETSFKGYETRLRTKSGALIDVLIYSQAIELSGEQCFLTSVIDITERVRAEEQLKTTSEQLRALSSSVQTAREEESKRIAREIHDELGGALTSWRWDLEEIRDAISESMDSSQVTSATMRIDAMIELTETTLDTVRKLSSELRPMALELGLIEALEWQAIQFRERTGIQVDLISSMEKAGLENGAATAVFRILQEALTNIQRHAQATKVVIAARQEAGNFILTIKDNGRGISDDDKSATQSLGLLGMRERGHLVGGEVNIEVAKEGGTEITVRIPLSDGELTAHH